jgi:hypothetical protein
MSAGRCKLRGIYWIQIDGVIFEEERDDPMITDKFRDALSITLKLIDIDARVALLEAELLSREIKIRGLGRTLAVDFEIVKLDVHGWSVDEIIILCKHNFPSVILTKSAVSPLPESSGLLTRCSTNVSQVKSRLRHWKRQLRPLIPQPESLCPPPTRAWQENRLLHSEKFFEYLQMNANNKLGVSCRLDCGKFFSSYAAAEYHHKCGRCEIGLKPENTHYCRWADVEDVYCQQDLRKVGLVDVSLPKFLQFPIDERVAADPVGHHERGHRRDTDGLACHYCKLRYADEYERGYHEEVDH